MRAARLCTPLAACALALLPLPALADQAVLESLELQQTEEAADLVLEFGSRPQSNTFTLKNPPRLVVDMDAAVVPRTRFNFSSGAIVKGLRTAENRERMRLVLDLSQDLRFRAIEEPAGDSHRLLVQLVPPQGGEFSGGRDVVIVIDAGHGGRDPGAVRSLDGQRVLEKRLVMSIAGYLRNLFASLRGYKVILTRSNDTYVPLRRRYGLAREQNADLFISLHADSAPSRSARGASVYVVSAKGDASSELASFLAEHANQEVSGPSGRVGNVTLSDEEDFNRTIVDLASSATLDKSMEVARKVLASFRASGIRLLRDEPGRANFVVLRSPDVPSILVETGFLSNDRDARNLGWSKHRRDIAWSLFRALDQYLYENPPQGSYLETASRRAWAYKVVANDNLSSLAQRYRTSTRAILKASDVDGSVLKIGQVLLIPRS